MALQGYGKKCRLKGSEDMCNGGNESNKGLLKYIAEKTGCTFLSDLHQTEHVEIEKVLIGLDIETYSQKEWNDAVRYLTGKILEFATKEAALAYIRDHKK